MSCSLQRSGVGRARFELAHFPTGGHHVRRGAHVQISRSPRGSLAYDALARPALLPPDGPLASGSLALLLAALNVVAVSVLVFTIIGYALVNLRCEQASVEELLLNILPPPIAERGKDGESFIAASFEEVTVLFADVVGFTRLAAAFPADNTVGLLNEFSPVSTTSWRATRWRRSRPSATPT